MSLGILFLAIWAVAGATQAQATEDKKNYFRKARVIETARFGIQNPAGLAFLPATGTFLVVPARGLGQVETGATDIAMITSVRQWVGSVKMKGAIAAPINMAYDGKAQRLYLLDVKTHELVELGLDADGYPDPGTVVRIDSGRFGLQDPRGMTADPSTGRLFVLDGSLLWIVRIEPDTGQGTGGATAIGNGWVSYVDLKPLGQNALRGIAFNPANDHLYLLSPAAKKLYEITGGGGLVAVRDLASLGISDPQGMVFAPSGDQTDDPGTMSLYIADSGLGTAPMSSTGTAGTGNIVELSLTPTAQLSATATSVQATLVHTIDTSQFSPPSPDPAGLAYLPASDTLLISDSEVDEMSIFTGENLYEFTRSGVLVGTSRTTAFSNEPTGVILNPSNGHYFFADDDVFRIYEVDPGADGLFATSDDIVTSIYTGSFGSFDTEDVTYVSGQGVLYMVDGDNAEAYRIDPGANGLFDGVPPDGDDLVTHFDTAVLGVVDPEGISFDPVTGHLFILGQSPAQLSEVTLDGTLIRTIDLSAVNFLDPGQVAVAPGSLDPTVRNLYITDQGIDNNVQPDENDGRVYEMAVPQLTPGNDPPSVDAGLGQTVTLAASAVLDGTVNDDGLPNPPGAVTTVWSAVSGPGLVTFADPAAVDTSASFGEAGTYLLRLSASDGELEASDEVAIAVTGSAGAGGSVDAVPITDGADDAEEDASGSVTLTSNALELTLDQSAQVVGLRFQGVAIPPGATIDSAYIQFQAHEATSEVTSLTIQGQESDNAPAFTTAAGNISSRLRTTAAVAWTPPSWLTVGDAGTDQRTTDIAAVIQEIVNRPGWASGNALAIIVTGSGRRVADSYEGSASGAPTLHVAWSPAAADQPPVVTSFTPASGEPATVVTVQGSDFFGTTSVAINGTPAEFRVVSDGELQALVPAGATSGAITVTNGVGTGSSANAYTVEPSAMVLVGAGDMAGCTFDEDEATASLLDNIPGIVFALGDNVYENGTAEEYADCYDPTWGRHKARTRPTPGNHDYGTPGATPYYDYFGVAAGDAGQGYYSYDVGTWHVVVLNSECAEVGGCGADSPQGQWLQADLAAHPSDCTLAYWHDPLYSSSSVGNAPEVRDFWEILYAAGAELVLNGHAHSYERFARQDPYGAADPAGIREFVVGTGGDTLHTWGTIQPNSVVRNRTTYGVLKLTLHPTSYDWQFIPIAGQTFTDSGTALCSGAPADTQAPTVTAFDLPATSDVLTVPINTFTASDDVEVTGYLATESATTPAAGDAGWSANAPSSYTFASAGSKILYAWAKDAAGNVSASVSDTVEITLSDTQAPTVTAFDLPATYSALTVPITTFTASDDVGVTGYLATESAIAPAATDTGWSATASTSYTFASEGSKTLYGWAKDAAGNVSASLSATVDISLSGGGSGFVSDVPVQAGYDDAEEQASGRVSLTSGDLELIQDKDDQTVGIRFVGLPIPRGATILGAYVQFTVKQATSGATTLLLQAEAADNAAAFANVNLNISSRPRTTASATWSPLPWQTVGAAGPDQRSVDLAAVVQEVVSRPGWTSGNALAIIITGSGRRVAESYNGDAAAAPLLHVVWSDIPDTTAPTVTAFDLPTTSPSLTVPITTFTASDDVEVTGYLATESATAPAADDAGWSATAPTSYTFASDGSKILYGWAKDAADNISASLSDTVDIALDTTAPVVTAFDLPATADTLTVPINTFSANDDVGVTGYLATESATAPAANDADWSATAPTSHTFASAGTQTLYGWAKDAAGNVSASLSDTVDIALDSTAPTVTAFDLPSTSSSLTVPINTFTATDDVGVTGYLATESATAPAATDAGWSAAAPSSYIFSSTGTKTLYGWAKDAAGNVSASLSATVEISLSGGGSGLVSDVPVQAGYDDAEEQASGRVSLQSGDLELVQDKDDQTVGIRFAGFPIPRGATILGAYVQFTVKQATSVATTLLFQAEAADNAAAFDNVNLNISSRPRTTAAATWSPLPWQTVGAAGPDQRSVDLAAVVQEVVSRPGWTSGNALAIIITGSGRRVAESYNGDAAAAPLLHVVWSDIPDTTAPTVTAFDLPSTSSSLTVPINTFTASDDVGVTGYLATESATAPESNDAGWSASALTSYAFASEGSKTLYGWAKDAAGNVSASLSDTVEITLPDSIPPVVTAFDLPATSDALTVPINTFTASDDVEVTGYLATESATAPAANDAGWSASAPTSYAFASEGSKTLYGWAKDAADNVSASLSDVVEITLPDSAPPTVIAFDLPANSSSLTVPITTFTATDDVGVTGYLATESATAPTANDAGWSAAAPSSHTFISAGSKTLYGWAKDAAGNVSTSRSDTVEITLDTTVPTVTAFDLPTTSESLIVPITTFTATDDIGVTGYLATESATAPAANDAGWSATAPTSYTFAGEGSKTLYGWAKDAAGNVSAGLSDTVEITLVDTQAPEVTAFDLPSTSSTLTVSITTFTATDDTGVTGYLATESATAPAANAAGWSASVPTSYTFAGEGSKILYGWAKDAAGNVSASLSDTVTITLPDTTAPTVTAFDLPATSNTLMVPITTFTATDDVAVTGYLATESATVPAANDAGWSAGAPTSYTFASEGSKTLYGWAKDAAGNISASLSDTVMITLPDTQAPTVTGFDLPATSSSLTVPINIFTASDNVGVTGYLATESATAPAAGDAGWSASAPTSYTFASESLKTLYGWAKDAAGNISASLSDTVTITLPDTTAPTVTAFDLPSTSSSLTVPINTFTATDDVGVTGYLATESATSPTANDSGWSASAPTSYTFASEGSKTLYGWAKDEAGNVSVSLSDTVTIALSGGGNSFIAEVRVQAGYDDAEEQPSGSVSLISGDLELVQDKDIQTVGIRFDGVNIPQGATILSAYVQFQVQKATSVDTALLLQAEADDSAAPFEDSSQNISSRPRTTASATWSPAPWQTVGDAGPDQRSADLAAVVQEMVSRPGWTSGNALAIIVTGSGRRVADSYNGNPAGAPLLHVVYQ